VCLAATVPLVGWLGTRLWGRQVGLVGALLLAVNPFARYYGQEARAYTLAMLFIGILLLGAYGYARRPGPRPWAVYILGGIAALYTHYFARRSFCWRWFPGDQESPISLWRGRRGLSSAAARSNLCSR
jgi:uncharacterized membrane protein